MLLADGTSVMELVANKVPCVIDVFTQMLDKSITIDEKECGLVSIFTQTKPSCCCPQIPPPMHWQTPGVCFGWENLGVVVGGGVVSFSLWWVHCNTLGWIIFTDVCQSCNILSQVRLDFRRVFRNTWNTRSGQRDMDFFFGLMKSPMKTCLEHPLLWAFLNMKLVQVWNNCKRAKLIISLPRWNGSTTSPYCAIWCIR